MLHSKQMSILLATLIVSVAAVVSMSNSWGASPSQEPPCIGNPPSDGLSRATYAEYTAEPYLAQSASKSNLIVMGTITRIANVTVTGDGVVYTHYLLIPSVYLKGQSRGDRLIVTRLGGSCGSYRMIVYDDFDIKVGEEYILFLSNRTGYYGIAYGWQGIYPVIDGKIYSMLSAGRGGPDIPSSRMINGWILEQFRAEIEKSLIVTTLTQTVTETRILVNGTSTTTTVTQTTTRVITTTSVERVTEPTTYIWAIGATITVISLAAVLTLRKRISSGT